MASSSGNFGLLKLCLLFLCTFILIAVNFGGGECAPLKSHSQFVKALYGRNPIVECAKNASVCLDPVKNPEVTASSACCFNKFCKDLSSDRSHCGKCGNTCSYGFSCCGGFCIDINSDPKHCGACFYHCPKNDKCNYGMCGYG